MFIRLIMLSALLFVSAEQTFACDSEESAIAEARNYVDGIIDQSNISSVNISPDAYYFDAFNKKKGVYSVRMNLKSADAKIGNSVLVWIDFSTCTAVSADGQK